MTTRPDEITFHQALRLEGCTEKLTEKRVFLFRWPTSLSTQRTSRVSLPQSLEGLLTKYIPHIALKMISSGRLTFDERLVLHRVDQDIRRRIHCYLSQKRFHICFETFHSRLLSRWAALLAKGSGRYLAPGGNGDGEDVPGAVVASVREAQQQHLQELAHHHHAPPGHKQN